MDFVSKALGSLSLGLPFSLGDEVALKSESPSQPWKLFNATLKKDSSTVSVFDYADEHQQLAKTATTILRKLKLPGVVKHIDTIESGRHVYVVTERVVPTDLIELTLDARKFVLLSLLQCLGNVHAVAKCSHNNISTSTVMQAQATGRFVLVGFESATFDGAPAPLSMSMATKSACPPEGWSSPTIDTYQFGVLVSELIPSETRLVATLRAQRRPTIAKLATSQSAQSVLRNPLTQIVNDISQALLMPAHELDKLCRDIDAASSSLYPGLVQYTILPELLKAKKPETFRTILSLISILTVPLDAEDQISDYIVQQFSSLDRVVRLELLRHLPEYIDILADKVVQQKIMPKMAFGFADTEVVVRKASVAAVEYLVRKLSSRQRNSELLRLLAKTHNDTDADVRALTTTVLCRIASRLDNRSVVSTAVGRALKDPEPRCRRAALHGVTKIDVPVKEIAEKLLGPAAGGMLDSDRDVAEEASRVTDFLLRKIREAAKLESSTVLSDRDAVGASSPPELKPPYRTQSRTPSVPPSVPTPLSTLNNASLPFSARETSLARTAGFEESVVSEVAVDTNAWAWDEDEGEEEGEEAERENSEPIEVDEDAWGW